MIVKIIAILLIIVPIIIMGKGLKTYKERKAPAGLMIALVGIFILFILGLIATGKVLYPMMVCVGMIMIYALRQSRKQAMWGQPVATLCAVFAVLVALTSIGRQLKGCEGQAIVDDAIKRAARIEKSRSTGMGSVLAANLAGKNVLIIDYSMEGKIMEARHKALKAALSGKVNVVGIVSPEVIGMPDQGITAEEFDQLLAGSSGYDVIISFVGLPMQPEKLALFKQDSATRPKFVLIHGYGLKQALQLKWAIGAILTTPEIQKELGPLYNLETELSDELLTPIKDPGGYVYVDSENFAAMNEKYPEILRDNPMLMEMLRDDD